MIDRRTVWAVTEGTYSDYRVIAIFEDAADAEAAVANGLGESVETRPYFPRGAAAPKKVTVWRASATVDLKTGDILYQNMIKGLSAYNTICWDFETDWTDTRHPGRPAVAIAESRGHYYIHVCARTEKMVVKALADLLAKKRAEILGL